MKRVNVFNVAGISRGIFYLYTDDNIHIIDKKKSYEL